MFYILSQVVPGLVTFPDSFLTGKFHRKPYIFQSTSSSYLNLNVVKNFQFVTGI